MERERRGEERKGEGRMERDETGMGGERHEVMGMGMSRYSYPCE